MSTQKIPNRERQIIQSNVGDYRGNLWSTFNIDLDSSPGVIKTAPRLKRVLGADEIGDGHPQALQVYDGEYYAVTDETVHTCRSSNDPRVTGNWSEETPLSSEVDNTTDVTSFNGLLLLSHDTNITSWDGSTKNDDWWTTVSLGGGTGSALTNSFTHTMEVLRTGNDTLFVTDKNVVRYANTAAGHTSVTLESLFVAHTLSPALDRMWVGTYTEVENNAFMYEIQVGNDIANAAYPVEGRAVLTSFVYKNTPFVVTERGYIQAFNGAGFTTIAQFPWTNNSKVMAGARPGLVQDTSNVRAIHPKGAKVKGKYCYIYVNTDDEYEFKNLSERGPSGVWVLDLETYSLTHKYSLTTASTDYGYSKMTRSGPLLITNTPETRIMVLGEVETTEEGLWVESTDTPQGYFTTVRHESETVADAFEAFYVKSDTLGTTDEVNVKYRDIKLPTVPYLVDGITWLNDTQFTTTDALTDVEVGYEVEILAGYRAGHLAHITAIKGTTTKTVTIDESIGSLNETSDIQIDNWLKVEDTYDNDAGEYKRLGTSGTATHRQHKIVLTGDVTIREVISKSNSKHEL